MFLSPAELRELTGRQKARFQIAALRSMAVPFLLDADGRPKVARQAVSDLLGVKAPRKSARREAEIRWDLVG